MRRTNRKTTNYSPWEPTDRQRQFLASSELEVFFGGAAGGGKSVALLMAALQYVKSAGYAALIIRKDLPRLALAGGLIPRSHEWLAGTKAKWNQTRRQWSFPVRHGQPATLTFGYLCRPLDKFRYASSEFQYIAFDELTDFAEDDYLFLFSRLRKNTRLDVPLRIRAASNPGGVGHLWVKERFIEGAEPALLNAFTKHGRLYIPSRIADNEHLNEEEYRATLMHLPPVDRERLMNGDWSVQEHGKFHADWLRYFVEADGQLDLLEPSGRITVTIPERECRRYITIDPAGTSEDRARESKGWSPSWSVVQVWDQPPAELAKFLLLRHQVRQRVGIAALCDMIEQVNREWRPLKIWIEGEKLGWAAWELLKNDLPIECVALGIKDKVSRAARLIVKMERGEILLPKLNTTWRPIFEQELLAWTGHEREVCDQIDAAAHAANQLSEDPKQAIRIKMGAVRT